MRSTKKNKQKKPSWKNVVYLLKLTVFFGYRQQSDTRAGQKKKDFFGKKKNT